MQVQAQRGIAERTFDLSVPDVLAAMKAKQRSIGKRAAHRCSMQESRTADQRSEIGELLKIVSPRWWPVSDIPAATTSRRRHHHAAAIAALVRPAIHPYCILVMGFLRYRPVVAAFSSRSLLLRRGNIRAIVVIVGLRTRCSSRPPQRVAQQVLDVRIQTAEIVVGPSLHRVKHGRIDT